MKGSKNQIRNKDKMVLKIVSKKYSELDKSTIDVKDTVNNLKKHQQSKILILFQKDNKNKILEYINKP